MIHILMGSCVKIISYLWQQKFWLIHNCKKNVVTRSKMHNLPTYYLLKKKKICRTMTPSPALASSQSEVSATRLRFIAQCSTATSWGIFINFMKILMRIRFVRQRKNPTHEQTNKQTKHENLFWPKTLHISLIY